MEASNIAPLDGSMTGVAALVWTKLTNLKIEKLPRPGSFVEPVRQNVFEFVVPGFEFVPPAIVKSPLNAPAASSFPARSRKFVARPAVGFRRQVILAPEGKPAE